MFEALQDQMLQAAVDAGESTPGMRVGSVTSYDPGSFSVRVMLQPENVLSGWIPLKTLAVGNGFGLYCAPNIGDLVEVDFQQDDIDGPSAGLRFAYAPIKPPPVEAGEILIKHQQGALIKLNKDGDVEVIATGNLSATVGGNLTAEVTGNASFKAAAISSEAATWTHKGALQVLGLIAATGSITDLSGSNAKTMQDMRTVYNTHTHAETGTGGGTTNPPNQQT